MKRKNHTDTVLDSVFKEKSLFWERAREHNALELFHRAADGIPAYKDFLKKNKVSPGKIKSFKDFQLVPPTNKKDYLRQYPFEKLIWNGSLQKGTHVWTSTSGSTGAPFYFPRTEKLDEQYSFLAEMFLKNSSYGSGPTLVIIGFGMGVWIGGLITYKAFEIAGNRMDQHISILTPGINKQEIFHALTSLAPNFHQTVLIGYPPFVKDVIEEAIAQNINIKKLNVRLMFAAEAFTESFRKHLAKLVGIKNLYRDTLNIYGSADLGAMAFETPYSIFIRDRAVENRHMFKEFFMDIEKTPTVAQYNSRFITFESLDGEIALTGDNTIPLIRYTIGDHGGAFSAADAMEKLSACGVDMKDEENEIGVPLPELPFVYVYERSDFSTKLYGAIIYPEHIKEGLAHSSLQRFVTGRFTMATKFNDAQDEYLEINVEMKPGVKKNKALEREIQQRITDSLLKRNAEHRNNHHSMPQKVAPVIVSWEYENPTYFKQGIKQKWVVKTN